MTEYTSDGRDYEKAVKKLVRQFAKLHMQDRFTSYVLSMNGKQHPRGAASRSECKAQLRLQIQHIIDGREACLKVSETGLELELPNHNRTITFRVQEA